MAAAGEGGGELVSDRPGGVGERAGGENRMRRIQEYVAGGALVLAGGGRWVPPAF